MGIKSRIFVNWIKYVERNMDQTWYSSDIDLYEEGRKNRKWKVARGYCLKVAQMN